ncbi:hypothetical protein N8T08_009525 [Aspergillus melleus]|uniref:Uncharacterized protein n=1 Tax=Aspergillus melleus TaxID=138277 RepID=A0ACC3BCQ1_9EURO|nr:hypothetical protein N8T08_009525 [Aspergillus melleus]
MASWRKYRLPNPVNAKDKSLKLFDPESKNQRSIGCGDYLRALFKNVGVAAFNNISAKLFDFEVGVTEKPKVFMHKIALLILNAMGHYIGGELSGSSGQDLEKLGGTQLRC